jgi:hypothetical protein
MKFEEIPKEKWVQPIVSRCTLLKAYKNRDFLVQIYEEPTGYTRLSINRTKHVGRRSDGSRLWKDGITWDQLQTIKNTLGYENSWLVECYPPEPQLVNVANIRHLFVLPEDPVFGWHRKNYRGSV